MGGKPRGVLAWHFVSSDRRLGYGDNREVAAGKTYIAPEGDLKLCKHGMHASIDPLDALGFAPSPIVCRVLCWGEIERGDDKLVARRRKVIWMSDATDTLREFARWCALQVIDLWDAPDVVRRYLETGAEDLRSAARDAAWDAVWAAAWSARDAARDAAWDAVRSAARDAARDAARAWDAARARNAAWAATWAWAWDAAWGAARNAAWAATWAWDAAWGAARSSQSKQLHKMLMGLKP